MSHTRYTPVRLLAILSLVLGLTGGLLTAGAVGPTTPGASALVSAAKAGAAADWARSRKGAAYGRGGTGPSSSTAPG